LRRIDLHLLACFDAMLAERNVSRAAERLDISQPAMSGALSRLREVFGDPLFTRSASGMVPTARARALQRPVADVIRSADELLGSGDGFVPAAAIATVTIQSGSDYLIRLLVPPMAKLLAARAPRLRLVVAPPNPRAAARMLMEGQYDLGVGYLPDPPETLHRKVLFRDPWVVLVRRDHPLARSPMTLAAYSAAGHVDVSPSGARHYGRLIDRALERNGAARSIALSVPAFLAAAPIVAETDLVATVPARVATLARGAFPVLSFAAPMQLPELEICLYWHERSHREALHRWFRQMVLDVAGST
jgi:DNA-binding transcriptional LysR family regulator